MNCHYCGTELHDNEIFCRHCGTRQQCEPETAEMNIPELDESILPPVIEAAPAPRTATVYKEKTFDWQPYGAPAKEEPLVNLHFQPSKLQLPVKRSLVKMFFLGILTVGIYPMVIWSRLVSEVNIVASRHDGQRSMPFFGMLLLSPLTLGIHSLVWMNKLCRRIGSELQRRSVPCLFGAKDFWLWAFLMGILSSICTGVCSALITLGSRAYAAIWILAAVSLATLTGPLVFTAKLMNAMNHLNEDFNING
ncbi:MAG: DUF4234 domain-containing protein [Oscillospiraceae bacterium]|nr:DUF4234 domain-containing protein [Oscillospiraceae bacterium]